VARREVSAQAAHEILEHAHDFIRDLEHREVAAPIQAVHVEPAVVFWPRAERKLYEEPKRLVDAGLLNPRPREASSSEEW
jgi:hypothetical protein